jgi:hypothetical protein
MLLIERHCAASFFRSFQNLIQRHPPEGIRSNFPQPVLRDGSHQRDEQMRMIALCIIHLLDSQAVRGGHLLESLSSSHEVEIVHASPKSELRVASIQD